MKVTKNQKALAEKLGDPMKQYKIDEAIQLLKDLKRTKFDETIEVALNLGVDPRHADQMVRGMVTLPSGTGKDVKVPCSHAATRLKPRLRRVLTRSAPKTCSRICRTATSIMAA